jgi:hypothetical protein
MKTAGPLVALLVGLVAGGAGVALYLNQPNQAQAANADRFEDYIICTGACAVNPKAPTDGVWLLDYKSGKLLGTVIDRTAGKILGWAELDLVPEYNLAPRQNVHFLMTTGTIASGQAALYLAETSTGKIGVYTMGSNNDGGPGISIRRHDMVLFRKGG